MNVRYLRRALRDLERIDAYLRSESPRGAARVAGRIKKRADDLGLFPEQGTPSQRRDLRQLFVSGTSYLIIYRVRDAEVQIITIVHAKQKRRS